MKIFAIGDLHLPGGQKKPMDIFGDHWKNHWEKIKGHWAEDIGDQDIVLIPGDISWAMTLDDAMGDLDQIGRLPGEKILIKGNHDYWWSSVSQIRRRVHDSIHIIQNDSIVLGAMPKIAFCGTRGWTSLGVRDYTEHDQKIFDRELNRLKLSLDSGKDCDEIIVLIHYPPFDDRGLENQMAELLSKYPIKDVVFGHLHGDSLRGVTEGEIGGRNYHLVSCDYLDFRPKLIKEV